MPYEQERQPLLDSGSCEVEMGKGEKTGRLEFRGRYPFSSTPRAEQESGSVCVCSPELCKALMTITCVLTTLAGAAVVGFGVTALWTPEYQPAIIMEQAPSLYALTQSLSIVGGIVVLLSLFGCIAVVSETARCTLWQSVLSVMSIVAQIVIAGFTLFERTQVSWWARDEGTHDECENVDCEEEFQLAFCMLTPAAGFLLGCIALQVLLLCLSYTRNKQMAAEFSGQGVVPADGVDADKSGDFVTPPGLAHLSAVKITLTPATPIAIKDVAFDSESGSYHSGEAEHERRLPYSPAY